MMARLFPSFYLAVILCAGSRRRVEETFSWLHKKWTRCPCKTLNYPVSPCKIGWRLSTWDSRTVRVVIWHRKRNAYKSYLLRAVWEALKRTANQSAWRSSGIGRPLSSSIYFSNQPWRPLIFGYIMKRPVPCQLNLRFWKESRSPCFPILALKSLPLSWLPNQRKRLRALKGSLLHLYIAVTIVVLIVDLDI